MQRPFDRSKTDRSKSWPIKTIHPRLALPGRSSALVFCVSSVNGYCCCCADHTHSNTPNNNTPVPTAILCSQSQSQPPFFHISHPQHNTRACRASPRRTMYGPASGGGGGGGGGRGDMGGQIIGPGGGPGGRGKPRLLTPKGQMAGMNAPPPLSSLPPRKCVNVVVGPAFPIMTQ